MKSNTPILWLAAAIVIAFGGIFWVSRHHRQKVDLASVAEPDDLNYKLVHQMEPLVASNSDIGDVRGARPQDIKNPPALGEAEGADKIISLPTPKIDIAQLKTQKVEVLKVKKSKSTRLEVPGLNGWVALNNYRAAKKSEYDSSMGASVHEMSGYVIYEGGSDNSSSLSKFTNTMVVYQPEMNLAGIVTGNISLTLAPGVQIQDVANTYGISQFSALANSSFGFLTVGNGQNLQAIYASLLDDKRVKSPHLEILSHDKMVQ